jgi:7,8-dihydro-6-hydroxymethylpterin-pyrophosphokinase
MELLLDIERQMGRIRLQKWGPRIIDLDLLDFRGEVLDTEALRLPHPWLAQRAFVLVPWAEIAPSYQPGCMEHTIQQLLNQLPESEVAQVQVWRG